MTTRTTDVSVAEREAAEAAGAVQAAEEQLAAGTRSVTATALHKLRDAWRHADLTATGARERAERDRQAARLAGLQEVGRQVDALAQSAGRELSQALREVAEACARVRRLAGEHDAAVGDLVAAARDLRAEGRAPAGPRKTSAFVAIDGQSVIHKRTIVRPLAGRVRDIVALAVAGNPEAASEDTHLVSEMPEPSRADHYVRRRADGMVFCCDGQLPDAWRTQIRAGELIPMSEREIRAYMEGEAG